MQNRRRTVALMTVALIALALALPVTSQAIGTTVHVQGGTLEGAVAGDVLSFKGIPYAAPPDRHPALAGAATSHALEGRAPGDYLRA